MVEGTKESRQSEGPLVGVLLVHGIGLQQRGDTLTSFSEPLYNWIRSWVYAGNPPAGFDEAVRLSNTLLVRPAESGAPPYLQIEVTPQADKGHIGRPMRLLVAESWWAENFRSPSFRELWRWAFGIAPFVFNRYATRRAKSWTNAADQVAKAPSPFEPAAADTFFIPLWLRDDSPYRYPAWLVKVGIVFWFAGWTLLQMVKGTADTHFQLGYKLPLEGGIRLGGILQVVVGSVAAFVVQVCMLALLILGIVPPLRRFVQGLQLRIAGSVGDVFVLATSPARFSAMASQVRRDLDWLSSEKKCQAIAVIAHSQGTVVAHRALREGDVPAVRLFITFGSALSKLHAVVQALTKERQLFWSAVLTVGGVVAVLGTWLTTNFLQVTLGVLGGAFIITGRLIAVRGTNDLTAIDLHLPGMNTPGGLVWRDYFGTADPIPDGPLPVSDNISSCPVDNRHSLWTDHTTYWENREQFVSAIVDELANLANSDLLVNPSQKESVHQLFKRAGERRKQWVELLSLVRIASVLGVAFACWGLGVTWLSVAGAWGWRVLGSVTAMFLTRITEAIESAPRAASSTVPLGALGVAIVVGVLYRLVIFPVWQFFERKRAGKMFQGGPGEWSGGPTALVLVLAFIIPLALVFAPDVYGMCCGASNPDFSLAPRSDFTISAIFVVVTTEIFTVYMTVRDMKGTTG